MHNNQINKSVFHLHKLYKTRDHLNNQINKSIVNAVASQIPLKVKTIRLDRKSGIQEIVNERRN